MLFTAPVRETHRRAPTERTESDPSDLLAIVRQSRSDVPAITHVDYSARIQTVGTNANADFKRVLEAFHTQTGCPILINTSFNVRGEPIVCTPQDAYRCFMHTDIDLLVLEDRLLWKDVQPRPAVDEGAFVYELD